MDDFRIAGPTSGESDEQLLHQVVRIAGYAMNIRRLVEKEYRFCQVHSVAVPREPSVGGRHASCGAERIATPSPPR